MALPDNLHLHIPVFNQSRFIIHGYGQFHRTHHIVSILAVEKDLIMIVSFAV